MWYDPAKREAQVTHLRGLLHIVCVAGLLMLAMTGGVLGQSNWQVVTGPDGSFTLELPGAATYKSVAKTSAKGSPYTINQYSFDQHNKAYLFQSTLHPADVDLSDTRASHQTYLDAYAQAFDGGKWENVEWSKRQGYDGVEAVGTDGNYAVRILSIIAGQHAFDLSYYGPLGSAHSDEVNRVFASLKILPYGPPTVTYSDQREPLNRPSAR